MPRPPTNQVKDAIVIAAMPTANLRPWACTSDKAPLQVAQWNSRLVSYARRIVEMRVLPFSGV